MDKAADLLKLLQDLRADTTQLWTALSIVGIAVIGFVLKEPALRESKKARIVIGFGFAVFALGNLVALLSAHTGALSTWEFLNQQFGSFPFVAAIRPTDPWAAGCFHLALDAIVITTLVIAPKTTSAAKP